MKQAEVRRLGPYERLAYWISEREAIRIRKEAGHPMDTWTDDIILKRYRFCNVHREDDRVTRWIKENWRKPHYDDPNLWHAMLIARYINWPPTLAIMTYPEPWDRKHRIATERVIKLRDTGAKIFTGAYIVSTNGRKMDKLNYVLDLFDLAWKFNPMRDTLAGTYDQLIKIDGVGSFMAAQIIADLKQESILCRAPDWTGWCAPGPGSQRGLNRVTSRYLDQKWPIGLFIPAVMKVRARLEDMNSIGGGLCLQDLQNCLCEFDKYERVMYDEGRPRSLYHPTQEPLF